MPAIETISKLPLSDRHSPAYERSTSMLSSTLIAITSLFSRLYAAMLQRRQGEAHRHMARLLSQSGGRLTDDMERRFSEHLIGNGNLRLD